MARPLTPFRNEIKTRVEDELYDALHRYRQMNHGISEAQACRDLLRFALMGVLATMPQSLVHGSPEPANLGPRTTA